MLVAFHAAGITLPVIFYEGRAPEFRRVPSASLIAQMFC
jgi:hypothetical protein